MRATTAGLLFVFAATLASVSTIAVTGHNPDAILYDKRSRAQPEFIGYIGVQILLSDYGRRFTSDSSP